ncbi:MAG: alkaline phosphatase family protein [Paludibacter sp.]|nr:alkaline phosphatase family protein [Paludibacter sp.]
MFLEKSKIIIAVIALFAANCAFSQGVERPKLVVGIVVDQMRWDYLYRFYDRYGNRGFRRMINEGFSCENTTINYLPTFTAVGHTSIYTGSVPSLHGIAGNDFFIKSTGKEIHAIQDDSAKCVGNGNKEADSGKYSAVNIKVTTLTDELKFATNFRSKVISIAIKDRGSILPAGHTADAAYWFDKDAEKWITSTKYRDTLPEWLTDYNRKQTWKKYVHQDWVPLFPIETYVQSTSDNNNYENMKFDKKNFDFKFPIHLEQIGKKIGDGNMICETPFGNNMTLDVVRLAIENEQLGADNITDFLSISFSSPDYVGHRFGPNSIKIEDNYLRLDKELGDFLDFLDNKVGKGNYLVFLTADHAVAHNAQFLIDNKISANNWNQYTCADTLNYFLKNKNNIDSLVINLDNYQVNFDIQRITNSNLNYAKIKEETIEFLSNFPEFQYVVDATNVWQATIPDRIKEMISNGYNREFSGDVQLILKAGYYTGSTRVGTTHGSWNPYDTHIPLLFFGWKIPHATTYTEVFSTDIAPTLAALLQIQMPSGCIGTSIFGKAQIIKK